MIHPFKSEKKKPKNEVWIVPPGFWTYCMCRLLAHLCI